MDYPGTAFSQNHIGDIIETDGTVRYVTLDHVPLARERAGSKNSVGEHHVEEEINTVNIISGSGKSVFGDRAC